MHEINADPLRLIAGIRCFALDMDGTVYLDEEWIDGARDFLAKIIKTGRRFVFMSNNSSKNTALYYDKLSRMGLPITPEQLVTSGQATIAWLKRHYPGKRVFLLGNAVLKAEFSEEGIILSDEDPEIVVTAFDNELTYKKLCMVCDYVRSGIPFIATHPDSNCPTKTGFIPDIGATHAYIETSTGRSPDKIIGKPNAEIVDYLLEKTGAARAETAIVGDRLYTDVAAGVNNGLTGILVLSGEVKLGDLAASHIKPHLVFESVKEMIPLL